MTFCKNQLTGRRKIRLFYYSKVENNMYKISEISNTYNIEKQNNEVRQMKNFLVVVKGGEKNRIL